MAELTPMMQQYLSMKEQNPDCILFFRLGDFYEMFFDDAKLVSNLLSLTLTSRDRNVPEEERVPMCGVPYHSADGYIARLIRKGYRVAICEQIEDPALAKGLVKRDIVRIISPGALIEQAMLDETRNNYIACAAWSAEGCGVCFCDVSTGEMSATEFSGDGVEQRVITEFGRYTPREAVLCPDAALHGKLMSFIKDRLHCPIRLRGASAFTVSNTPWTEAEMEALGLSGRPLAARAVGGLLDYLKELMRDEIHISLNVYEQDKFLELDLTAKQNLELTETIRSGEKRGTLLWVMDMTKTAMGGRLLRGWLERPLVNPADINRRLFSVGELADNVIVRGEVRSTLQNLPDMERILTRVLYGTAGARDLRSLRNALECIPEIKNLVNPLKSQGLREINSDCDPIEDVFQTLDAALVENPPFSVREGGFIRDGYNKEVDRLRGLISGAREAFAELEAEERKKTGIKSLKISYNKVFGYYIEVSKSYYEQVPAEYTRKQTLANCERYVTQELKALEAEILSAGDTLAKLEGELFAEMRNMCVENAHRIQRTAQAVARLDALCSFAEAARAYDYTMPTVDYTDICRIKEGRHPVVERMLDEGLFVPNDTELTRSAPTAIITGPNMAGKSTYMRQIALITLLAQAGSFVPARSAHIGVVDRIFTRVGASDDVAGGRSTFMVEMSEVSDILQFATKKSLILFDEVGRGTSTFDGMSVAQAVLEYTHKKIGAKTLFATHYHELTALEENLSGVKNYSVSVKKRGEDIIFLRRIVPGGADDSFGVEVARLAGLPDAVITRAKTILKQLESYEGNENPSRSQRKSGSDKKGYGNPCGTPQVSMEQITGTEIMESLKRIDINTVSPIEALNILYRLVQKAK